MLAALEVVQICSARNARLLLPSSQESPPSSKAAAQASFIQSMAARVASELTATFPDSSTSEPPKLHISE